jgi:hypothetical protein
MPHSLITVDWQEYDRLREVEGLSLTQAAKRLGVSQATLSRCVAARLQLISNGQPQVPEEASTGQSIETFRRNVEVAETPPTILQPIEHVGEVNAEPSTDPSAEVQAELAALKSQVAELNAHCLKVNAWMEAFQRQAVQRNAPHGASMPAQGDRHCPQSARTALALAGPRCRGGRPRCLI